MEFLYGSQADGAPKYKYVEGLDYRYDAWEVNGIWHQELKVVGGNKAFIILTDEEVMLWKHLDLAKRPKGSGNPGDFFLFLVIAFCLFLLFLAIIYTMLETVLFTYAWYLTYPLYILAPILAIIVPLFVVVVRNYLVRIKRKQVLLSFLKNLKSETGRNTSYYRAMLIKIANVRDKDRAETARMLLDKGLV